MALSQGGRGPAERGFAIDFLIVVTLLVILPLSGDGGDGAGGDSVFFRIAAVVARSLHPAITRQRKDYPC